MNITINNTVISEQTSPFIIAELSANHNGSLERAKLSIKAALDCGADAVKIQTYTADTMTIDCEKDDFIINGGLWDGYTLYNLYNQACTPFDWHKELYDYARSIGITIFSTPFDETAVDLLESLDTPAYKIASFELTDLPLIGYVAKKGKPIIISTGMASEDEISEALEVARTNGCSSIILLHCISSYPAPIEQSNLKKILNLKNKFGVLVGLSDHSMGNIAAISSVAMGACVIEKHFTIDRNDKGPDSEFSIEPNELKLLVKESKYAWSALGTEDFKRPIAEAGNTVFRRSIYFVSNLKAGEKIKPSDIRRIRPGFGLPPKFFDALIGKTLKVDVSRGDPVKFECFKEV